MSSDSSGIAVVPVANQAGSAGKTTTVVTLAALLADAGTRVLVVDLDGQANATTWLGVAPENLQATAADVLLRRASTGEAIQDTNTDRVRLLGSSAAMDASAADLTRVTGGEQRLRMALTSLVDIDVVLIDCPGALSVVTVAAMVAATSVLTVTAPTAKELAGVPRVEDTVTEVAEAYNPGLRLAGIVPCIVPNNGGCCTPRPWPCWPRTTRTWSPPRCAGRCVPPRPTPKGCRCRPTHPASPSPRTTGPC